MIRKRMGMSVVAVVLTSLAVAGPAHADNGSDFLAIVSAEGINVGGTPADVQLTLATGMLICRMLSNDFTPQVAGRQVPYAFPNATPQQVEVFVNAAQAKLCETGYGQVKPGG